MLLRRFQPLALANAGRSLVKMRMLAYKSYASYDDTLRTVVHGIIRGSPRTIFKFVKGMESKGLEMDTNVKSAVIVGYIDEDRVDEARDYAIKNQSERELEEIFIREIFMRRGLDVGLKYLSQVQSPTASMQGSYLCELIKTESDPEVFFEIVDQMRSRGIVFNEFLYGQIFKVCYISKNFELALKERELMKKGNVPLGAISSRYLTEIYWNANIFQEEAIDELCDSYWKSDHYAPNTSLIFIFISLYLKMNKLDKVEGVFKKMKSSGMKLNRPQRKIFEKFCDDRKIGHLYVKYIPSIKVTLIDEFKDYNADISEILVEICENSTDYDEVRFAFWELVRICYNFADIVRLYRKQKQLFNDPSISREIAWHYMQKRVCVDAVFEFVKEECDSGHGKFQNSVCRLFIEHFLTLKKPIKMKQVLKLIDNSNNSTLDLKTYQLISRYINQLIQGKKLVSVIYNDIHSGDPTKSLFRCFVAYCVEFNLLNKFEWILEEYRKIGFDHELEISSSSFLIGKGGNKKKP
jgi:pentatricopeptide repeat protein